MAEPEINGHSADSPGGAGTRARAHLSLVKDVPDTTPTPPTEAPDGATVETAAGQVARARRAVIAAVRHERTRTAARYAARNGLYVVGGARVLTRRAWESRTTARYERMIRAAEATGQLEEAKEWEERAQRFRQQRHQRRMEMLTAPGRAAKGAACAAGLGAGGLLLLGVALAVSTENPADVADPTMFVVDLVRWMVFIGSVVWGPLTMAAPWAAMAGLWTVGRKQQAAPKWALPARRHDAGGEPITPSIVVTALRDLGIGPLKKAIKDMGDAGAAMLGPITLAGCGVEVDVTLPSGVSTEEVMNRRRKLAENLGRHEHEVYPTVAPAARTIRLWIADSGALDEPVPASPLVLDPGLRANYKTGRAPWGLDLRGDVAAISLFQKHLLVTGLSNQGKTAALRALALWLALDPTVEFRIADLKGVGDWAMFDGLATVLIQGPADEHVMRATHMVEDAFQEMQDRLQAPPGTVFPPLVVIIDEAQVAYGSGVIGKDKRPYGGAKANSRYFQAIKGIHDQGRAVNVTTWEGTQDPTNDNLPKRSREGNHIRASLVLGTEAQAKMALGETPVEKGAAPHKLRQGLDKGQVVATGDGVPLGTGQASMNIRTHYINGDEAEAIAEQAKQRRQPVNTADDTGPAEPADHLADIAAVLGTQKRMRTEEVRQRLAEKNPGEYRGWTASDLIRTLEAAGADAHKSSGVMVVSRARVLEALAERDDDTDDDADADDDGE
ncbi:ATP-binding protein [Streptomyces johnsoniae]|uniref:ATP-binding protein n=1 Tax=Streptomyces johnsoniae TaxID=3075532 RepID=A0ABU2SDQ4_9ACTN|nr:ATP-binding protein [Streptomyces sp. DSM 41886]MDT0445964.1 ATP-binding protein [Streptomyces sp. DSM 41886]